MSVEQGTKMLYSDTIGGETIEEVVDVIKVHSDMDEEYAIILVPTMKRVKRVDLCFLTTLNDSRNYNIYLKELIKLRKANKILLDENIRLRKENEELTNGE